MGESVVGLGMSERSRLRDTVCSIPSGGAGRCVCCDVGGGMSLLNTIGLSE